MGTISVDEMLGASRPVIDVRSPGEFAHGHIPGAQNVPLFDDRERAEIGTAYKRQGRLVAVSRGFELIGPKVKQLGEQLQAISDGQPVIVHCWRGGMRSEGVSWLAERIGINVDRLRGGYKSFRRAAMGCFADARPVVILGGKTGAGKTEILHSLRDSGDQIIDLEGLACHRGSAFGGIGQPRQPTVEHFENQLFLKWRELDPSRLVWIEGESKSIGRVYIPDPIWSQMIAAPTIFVEADREQRVRFLVEQYGDLPPDELAAAVANIKKRLGGERTAKALEALQSNDTATCVSIALDYYDKAYTNSLAKHPRDVLVHTSLPQPGRVDSIDKLRRLGEEIVATMNSSSSQ